MIFLTGATGLLGSAIAAKLITNGYQVKASYRPSSHIPRAEAWTRRVDWVEGNLLDPLFLQQQLKNCTHLVHCAGLVSFQPRDREALEEANLRVTEALINAALLQPLEKFVHISSVAALGRPRNKLIIDESQQWEDSDLNSYYAKTKHWAELEVWRGIAEGLPATILNPSVIIGYHPHYRSSSKLIQYVQSEHRFYPSGKLNWVGLEDVAEAVFRTLNQKQSQANRYVISAGSVSYQDFFSQLAQHYSKRPPYVEAKFYTMQLAYYLQKISRLFRKKGELISKETLKLSKSNIEFDNSKSKSDLKLEYQSLQEVIAQLPSA